MNSPDKIVTAFVSGLGVLGVMATIHSINDPMMRNWYAGAALALVVLAVLLLLVHQLPNTQAFPSRKALPPSLDAELGSANEVWLTMHTGSVKGVDGDLLKTRRKLCIVLSHPDSEALVQIAKIASVGLEKLQNDIRELTVRLKASGAEVYWFDGLIANAITIADPELRSGWARVEAILPFMQPQDRPSIKATIRRNPTFVTTVKTTFLRLTQQSQQQ